MAEIVGSLREDQATYGEKLVLKKLKHSLPKEFTVYVECPLKQPARHGGKGEMVRYPDFIVLANFGVIVLEVKDWVQVSRANKYEVVIRTRGGKQKKFKNPVEGIRRMALLLEDELKTIPDLLKSNHQLNVPWGYAVVFPNLPMSTITQLRQTWGEAFVLGAPDLDPAYASKRLRASLPRNQMLSGVEMELVRGVINPTIVIEPITFDQPPFLLDMEQERIIAEPVVETVEAKTPEKDGALQEELFEATPLVEVEQPPEMLAVEKEIIFNASVRLVRGVAGSGKSLVLLRRAQYLKSQYPEWNICALAFNRALADSMGAFLKGSGIKTVTFHKLCSGLLSNILAWKDPVSDARGWLKRHRDQWDDCKDLGSRFLCDEFKWIKEIDVGDLEQYLSVERRGRGAALQSTKRKDVYRVFEAYQEWLRSEELFDWADVPHLVIKGMDTGDLPMGIYDAILVDEAQDFAPIWFDVLKRLIKPGGGFVFLADDPAQSIYRYFSWREKGIPVVGRTRWLRIPYRNTRQIHEAAYAIIKNDEVLKKALAAQSGMILEPDLSSQHLRSGPKPELRLFNRQEDESLFIQNQIRHLVQQGVDPKSIAILCRRKRGEKRMEKALRGLDAQIGTYHKFKGLEFDHVFLTQIEECSSNGNAQSEEQLSEERRLVYMAMTRARNHLYISGSEELPRFLRPIEPLVDKALT